MKHITDFINESQVINEAEFCKPDDICYIVVNKDGQNSCSYLPYTGFGEGDELKKHAEAMEKYMGDGHTVKEVKFKDIKQD